MKLTEALFATLGILLSFTNPIFSADPVSQLKSKKQHKKQVHFIESCVTAQAQIDQDINNVRARLLTGGDLWWDRNDGKYVVPKPASGQPGVSAIYAAGIWMGGVDNGGNLKIACQTYGNNGGNSDFWPGPLNDNEGRTTFEICNNWDRFFEVKATEIHEHINKWQQSMNGGPAYTANQIPASVKAWPARGNPYFYNYYLFPLPDNDEGLAPFYDQNGDGLYEPLDGDFPTLKIRGCEEAPQIPDQMIFWMYNDEGGGAIHGETKGSSIRMQVNATAFAYSTLDQLNDMTFQQHKFINRAQEDIDSFHFALWMDPDLGCHLDDYLGCSPERNLAYWYNADEEDGEPGITCGDIPTYGTEIPAVGISIYRGPIDENGNELGMSSFTYYNSSQFTSGTDVPTTGIEFYRYITGRWKDGTPITYGGDGYDPITPNPTNITKYAFPSEPNDSSGWSMCHPGAEYPQGLPPYDRHVIQSCGPVYLQPGAVNELVFGVVYAPDMEYPCPNLSKLFIADDLAKSLFDECFIDFTEGPDAPDVNWVALDREIIGVLSNKQSPASNNSLESYEELAQGAPPGASDPTYKFEGYLVYQLAGPDVSLNEVNDVKKARLIFQTDVKNGLTTLVNWEAAPNPAYIPTNGGGYFVYQPKMTIQQANAGIQHSFKITEDQFAQGDRRLINHRKYYFMAVAYAANNYKTFDPLEGTGQQEMFVMSHQNIGPEGDGLPYAVIPRPIVDKKLNASYGDGTVVSRIDGVGLGGNFVDMSDESLTKIMDGSFDGEIIYKPGRAPIQVQVFDPLKVQDGEYELSFYDENMTNDKLDEEVRWQLKSLKTTEVIESDQSISKVNEQLFGQYGFSVTLGQTLETGDCDNENLGAIGAELAYADPLALPWFSAINYGFNYPTVPPFHNFFTYLPTFFDNECSTKPLVTLGDGYFVPYQYCQYLERQGEIYASPAWHNPQNGIVLNDQDRAAKLNNVDIVFTPDKNLWSRCVVVETFNPDFATYALKEDGTPAPSVGGSENFDLRNSPSVSKEDANGDGLPDTDGDGIGMGWFPGYAVDVETGKRLNIFFGENSAFSVENGYLDSYLDGKPNGADMLFNPNDQVFLDGAFVYTMMHHYLGGHHFIYVTDEEYDACAYLRTRFEPQESSIKKVNGLKKVTWTCMPLLATGQRLLPLNQGLIPNELHVKLRVDNPYEVSFGTGEFNGYPTYRFKLEGKQANLPESPTNTEQLARINVVPNPYYAYSDYETSSNSKVVKITNLPALCEVTIYSLDGRVVRHFKRDERGKNDGATAQIYPDLEWDLENFAGKPISAGVYLIRVQAPGIGERTLKWFGINRAKDFGSR